MSEPLRTLLMQRKATGGKPDVWPHEYRANGHLADCRGCALLATLEAAGNAVCACVTDNGDAEPLSDVWEIATQPYPGAHFATFPEALVEPCVKAGTSERGVCPECGAPWVREVEVEKGRVIVSPKLSELAKQGLGTNGTQGSTIGQGGGGHGAAWAEHGSKRETTGWRPSCAHGGGRLHPLTPVPASVLDCFAGSGTTGRVAQRLGRKAVLIDLSGEYLTQAMKRNADIPLGLETA